MEEKYITLDQLNELKKIGNNFTIGTHEGTLFKLELEQSYYPPYDSIKLIVSNPKWKGDLIGTLSKNENGIKIVSFNAACDSSKNIIVSEERTNHLINLFFSSFNDEEIEGMKKRIKLREEEKRIKATNDFFNDDNNDNKLLDDTKKFFYKLKQKIIKFIKDE